MSDVAVVVGHHPDAPGAVLTVGDLSIHEYELWDGFGRELVHTLHGVGLGAEVVRRPNEDPDQALADRVNSTGASCAIELHFNAASGPARGTEMLYWENSADGKRIAQLLHDKTTDALDTEPRGLKAIGSGYPFLQLTQMPAVICEPAFGSTRSDAWRLLTRQAELMKAYRTAILDWMQAV